MLTAASSAPQAGVVAVSLIMSRRNFLGVRGTVLCVPPCHVALCGGKQMSRKKPHVPRAWILNFQIPSSPFVTCHSFARSLRHCPPRPTLYSKWRILRQFRKQIRLIKGANECGGTLKKRLLNARDDDVFAFLMRPSISIRIAAWAFKTTTVGRERSSVGSLKRRPSSKVGHYWEGIRFLQAFTSSLCRLNLNIGSVFSFALENGLLVCLCANV
ncbi:hypothetical protein CDAR_100481 [Caerostris darwini]|uniref:Uncharacterized protein n=1 Tax=Caerostris darwini TaxID=1538125 RepID=A0AAV4X1U1_9ARAC|nr:hypothetical protein CDAR_100481 [Caerostris darwini]